MAVNGSQNSFKSKFADAEDWTVCFQGTKKKMENLLSLSKYIDVMRKLTALATGVKGISYFIATDDAEAEKMMRSSFEDGMPQTHRSPLRRSDTPTKF